MSREGHPRPMCRRDGWISLDGQWEFALDPEARCSAPREVAWTGRIEVPFAPETARSGVGETGYFQACWYRRSVHAPPLAPDQRLLLHFGAVDHEASVWLDGAQVATHEGGYTPFTVDITCHVREGVPLELVVRALDDPHDLCKPRGKQDWLRDPHAIWYPRTTGIWQPVWLERVHRTYIGALRWSSNLERWEIEVDATIGGTWQPDMRLHLCLRLSVEGRLLVHDTYELTHPELHRRIALSDPGIDDARNHLLWSPDDPTLIDAHIELQDHEGRVLDAVDGYTALRSVTIQGDQILLNGRPIRLRMVLDQGYWPDTGLSAPDDAALRRDVELARAMGFNGVRKHQKLEDPRYLYWADRLGLMVWAEMPSAYRFTRTSVQRQTCEWMAAIDRDRSHPCIIAWVPFNESWGVPNLPDNPAERSYVQALYHLTKTLDPTRPVVGNDGWESVATDIIGVHDYEPEPAKIAERYQADDIRANLHQQRYGGRILVIHGHHTHHHERPLVLTEFGGIALSDEEGTWGYARSTTPRQLERRLQALIDVVRRQEVFAGYCYTQFADTYQEANGLLRADRTPKIPLARIAAINGQGQAPPEASECAGMEV
jgi:beta-galactosidase/beta-glucuronidase